MLGFSQTHSLLKQSFHAWHPVRPTEALAMTAPKLSVAEVAMLDAMVKEKKTSKRCWRGKTEVGWMWAGGKGGGRR